MEKEEAIIAITERIISEFNKENNPNWAEEAAKRIHWIFLEPMVEVDDGEILSFGGIHNHE